MREAEGILQRRIPELAPEIPTGRPTRTWWWLLLIPVIVGSGLGRRSLSWDQRKLTEETKEVAAAAAAKSRPMPKTTGKLAVATRVAMAAKRAAEKARKEKSADAPNLKKKTTAAKRQRAAKATAKAALVRLRQ